jgi:plasmid stabilization system protein ParE
MAHRVIWSRTAERDLRSLVRYISKDGGLSAPAPPLTVVAMLFSSIRRSLRSWRALRETVRAGFRAKDAKGAKEFQNLSVPAFQLTSSSRSFLNSLGWDPQMTGRFPSASILHICGLIQSSSETHARRISRRGFEVGAMMIPISTIRLQRDSEMVRGGKPLERVAP